MTVTHLALRLLVLTGARSSPLRIMRTEHVVDDTWTIPGELMKGRIGTTSDFRIPLSSEAMRVIELVLPSFRGISAPRGGPISDATMARLMQRRGLEARPHGFRSSLRMWLAEVTDVPHEIAEMTLAHAFGNKVTRVYQRSDFLDQRRALMERLDQYVANNRATWRLSDLEAFERSLNALP